MSKGIVLFGINNDRIDYILLAIMASKFIRKNMPGNPICLITDENSINYTHHKCEDFFDDIVVMETNHDEINQRTYRDTQYYHFQDNFKNASRSNVYNLSPYDETLLLDSDYLICNDVLNCVWGCDEDVLINKRACDLFHQPLENEEDRLNKFGIKMYWATAIYFKKSKKAELLFGLVDQIKANWGFYKLIYDFPGSLFRNDYAFSIAIHILNGFVDTDEYFPPLPDDTILSALDRDQFYKINSANDLTLFYNDKKETWKFNITRTKGLNVHCMNKLSLLNNMSQIMEKLDE